MTCKTTFATCQGETSPALWMVAYHPSSQCAERIGPQYLPWCLGAGWYL
jgi:hypothetical protein